MSHNRDSRRSTREFGSSSNPQFQQSMPESGHLPSIPANPSNAYNFDARMRMTTSMKEREARMRNFKVLTPIYPHIPSLQELNILDEIKEHFVANGFGFVFMDDPPCVYEGTVREFIYSFAPVWIDREAPNCGSYISEWKFRMNGVRYRYSRRDLLRVFNIPDEDSYPVVDRTTRNNFWRNISGTNADYVPQQAATKIANPVWKFVHRFIATCVHLRKDEGRWVSKTDLDLMCCFYNNTSIDAITFLTNALEESTIPSFRGTYIGGGHLVTLLAQDAGFSLDPSYAKPLRFLKEEEMLRRGFIKTIRLDNGIVQTYLVGRDPIPGERQAPRLHPRDEAGPSSAPQPAMTIEELSAQFRTLANYTYDGMQWQGDMFQGLYTHLGCEGYKPPPQNPFWTGTTSGFQGEANAAYEEEESEDEMDEDSDGSAQL